MRALVEPQVLLLDEPFGALDARVHKELRAWLRRLHDEVHVTTIIVNVRLEPDVGASEAMVERVVHLGFEVRVELVREDGHHLLAQLTKEEAELLELERGQIIYVRRETVFTP